MGAAGGVGQPPSAAELNKQLGAAADAFHALVAALPGARQEWRTYGRNSGWVLKLVEGTRTMCYVQPAHEAFRTTVILGKAAAETALASAVSPDVKDAIRDARVYVEGRPVPLMVSDRSGVADVLMLLEAKRAPVRQASRARTPG